MRGGGLFDALKSVANVVKKVSDFAKDTKIISKGLNAVGKTEWADRAAKAGYGRRRRTVRRR
jgi:hypothetical protein